MEVVNKFLQFNLKLEEQIKERWAVEEVLKKNEEELWQVLEWEKEFSELKLCFVLMVFYEFCILLMIIVFFFELIKFYMEGI